MNRQERMISLHNQTLSGLVDKNLRFETYIPSTYGDNDTVISNNKKERIAVISRHLIDMTCTPTHFVILSGNNYDRL